MEQNQGHFVEGEEATTGDTPPHMPRIIWTGYGYPYIQRRPVGKDRSRHQLSGSDHSHAGAGQKAGGVF